MSEQKLTPLQAALLQVQSELKAPKNRRNNFGNYNYRDAEGILEAVKPLLAKEGLVLVGSDEVIVLGFAGNSQRFYVKATYTLSLGSENVTVTAFAREEETKKGMDGSQITGASSSYARKYALNGLFLIDDTKDSDGTNDGSGDGKPAKKPAKETAASKNEQAVENTQKPDASPQTEAAKPATSGLKELGTEGKAFDGAAAWVAGTEGMVIDVIDKLRPKYNITPEVEAALVKKASELRGGK